MITKFMSVIIDGNWSDYQLSIERKQSFYYFGLNAG